jgi:general secretion pathway protein G
MKKAFTMIEIVFVIVILGILTAVAMPKLSGVLEDANIAKASETVASIRSSIVNERQVRLIQGQTGYAEILDDASTGDREELFDGNASIKMFTYPVYSGSENGDWEKTTNNTGAKIGYRFHLSNSKYVDFNYTKATGTFDCNHDDDYCKRLSE